MGPPAAGATAMDEAKIRFLLGETAPGDVDLDTPEGREAWLEADTDLSPEERHLIGVVASQVAQEEPPEVWATARRLLGLGLPRDEVLYQLTFACEHAEQKAANEEAEVDGDAYVASLGWLPLPEENAAAEALIDIVRVVPGVATEEALRGAHHQLRRDPGDELALDFIAEVGEELTDGDGPLAWLSDDRLVHVGDLVAGSVLTHRLSLEEQRQGFLDASDLVGFDRLEPLRLDTGEEIEVVALDDEYLAWQGPEGWLAGYPPDALLGVRVDPKGMVSLTLVGEPGTDDRLTARVRRVYESQIEDAELPASLTEIALGLLIDQPDTFSVPRLPLGELCQAAGLEQRGNEVAHNPAFWANEARLRSLGAVLRDFDTDIERTAVLRALDAAREPDLLPEILREILDGLDDRDLLDYVADELTSPGAQAAGIDAPAFAARLLRSARRPRQAAIAAWLAAVIAERGGGTLDAESLVRQAVTADSAWDPALDRAGWYAFDRGEADEAARHWRAMESPPQTDLDLAERFAGATARQLGRNDPCWCGSGRKYKACHLGQPELPPLAERVGWLSRKAAAFLDRRGREAHDDVFHFARLLVTDQEATHGFADALDHPLLYDVTLTEHGWFARFLQERGPLLPEDEASLAAAWLLVARSVYEVEAITPGVGVTVRDARTGEPVEVRDVAYSRQAVRGGLICARAVPDGPGGPGRGGHQFVGAIFGVAPESKAAVLALCDEGSGEGLCAFVAGRPQPPASGAPEPAGGRA